MLCSTLTFSRGASDLAASGTRRSRSSQVFIEPLAEHPHLHAFGLQLGRLNLGSELRSIAHPLHHGLQRMANLTQWLHHLRTPIAHAIISLLPVPGIELESTSLRAFAEKFQNYIHAALFLQQQQLSRTSGNRIALTDFLPGLFWGHGVHMSWRVS